MSVCADCLILIICLILSNYSSNPAHLPWQYTSFLFLINRPNKWYILYFVQQAELASRFTCHELSVKKLSHEWKLLYTNFLVAIIIISALTFVNRKSHILHRCANILHWQLDINCFRNTDFIIYLKVINIDVRVCHN